MGLLLFFGMSLYPLVPVWGAFIPVFFYPVLVLIPRLVGGIFVRGDT